MQFYLGLMIAVDSETIYLEIHHNASSAVALFVSSLIYAGITAYVYYTVFMNVDRKEELKRWIKERNQRGHELAMMNRLDERREERSAVA